MLGFMVTGVCFPILGTLASAKAGGTIQNLCKPLGKHFPNIYGALITLSIGPLLAIPRTAATTHEMSVVPIFGNINPFITSIIFFSITLYFVLSPSGVIDKIGNILTPLLLVILLTMLVKSIVSPIGPAINTGLTENIKNGFVGGYQTMDALGSVVMAVVVVNGLKSHGITDKKELYKTCKGVGLVALVGLAIVYGGFVYIGSTAGTIASPDVSRVELLNLIAKNLLGNLGSIVLGLAVMLACLTTSIGLTATFGEFFSETFEGKVSYKTLVIICVAFSCIMSVLGVETIVAIAVPLLTIFYPMTLNLIIISFFDKYLNKGFYVGSLSFTLLWGIIEALETIKKPVTKILGERLGAMFVEISAVSNEFLKKFPLLQLDLAG